MDDIVEQIESKFGKVVRVKYKTKNLGNGSDTEQEGGVVTGSFNGNSTNAGRTLRYEFEPATGAPRLYLFIDEIESIMPASRNTQGKRIATSGLYKALRKLIRDQARVMGGNPKDRTGVVDALADIMHICDNHGLDFHDCVRSASDHYSCETGPDTE